jgi:hypothetical protein
MTGRCRTGPALRMLDVTPIGWAATLAIIAGLLALDSYLLGRRPHASLLYLLDVGHTQGSDRTPRPAPLA